MTKVHKRMPCQTQCYLNVSPARAVTSIFFVSLYPRLHKRMP